MDFEALLEIRITGLNLFHLKLKTTSNWRCFDPGYDLMSVIAGYNFDLYLVYKF